MLVKLSACFLSIATFASISVAQVNVSKNISRSDLVMNPDFTTVKTNPATPVKNQANTGTCWSFSTTSFLESELLRTNPSAFDISEMFTVRNIYMEKARNYILRQGKAQFDQGGLGHDVLTSVAKYGAVPESAYSGLVNGQKEHDHTAMVSELKTYLDALISAQTRPIKSDWMTGFSSILNKYLGTAPAEFQYNGVQYTPKKFATDVMKFSAADYVQFTSFTSQPYYAPFIVQVPDNFSNGEYYNLPLSELIDVVKNAVSTGASVMWDADVSNNGFRPKKGIALFTADPEMSPDSLRADMKEGEWSPQAREALYEGLVTQDDHLMHITGVGKSKGGKTFFVVKNSYGSIGPFKGYVNVSEAYFAMNTITLIVPKAAVSKDLLSKLKMN